MSACLTLGAVFLAATGGEALYTDLGHFGRKPIQIAWLAFIFPCLLLNYLGQGAMVLSRSRERREPVLPAGAVLGAGAARVWRRSPP